MEARNVDNLFLKKMNSLTKQQQESYGNVTICDNKYLKGNKY